MYQIDSKTLNKNPREKPQFTHPFQSSPIHRHSQWSWWWPHRLSKPASASGTSSPAPSSSATSSTPFRLTASSASVNGSSPPISSANLLPPLALSSIDPLCTQPVNTCRVLKKWHAHYRGVSCLVFRDDGSLLISGSEDGGIRVWSLTDYSVIIKVNKKAICTCITLRSTLFL
ncbi:unnamed protein product [Malus baccata var. baccata]